MTIKKILPLTAMLATTSVAVPLATSCVGPSKAIASWNYSQGIYNFTTGKAPKESSGLTNDKATEMYFTAEDSKRMLAEDIIWKISNYDASIETTFGDYSILIVPLSANVLVTKTEYNATKKYGVVSFEVTYEGYADLIDDETTVAQMYAKGNLTFTDIVLYVNYNGSSSTFYNAWNISRQYTGHETVILDTSKVSFTLNIPGEACTYWFEYNAATLKDPLFSLPGLALIEAMSPMYSNYLSNNTRNV